MPPPTRTRIKEFLQVTKSRLPVVPQLAVLAVLLMIIFSGAIGSLVLSFATPYTPEQLPQVTETEQLPASTTIEPPSATALDWEEVNIRAEAAYVWDVKNQRVLYEKNSTTVLPIASITKLMTALLATELLEDDAEVTIGATAARQDGGAFLSATDRFTHSAVATMALMASANDGAYALAATAGSQLVPGDGANAFVQAMNIRAEELNLFNTSFRNPTGLDISETEAGSYSTAKEASFLMEYVLTHHPELLAATTKSGTRIYNQDGSYYDIENTNHYLNQIPNVLGSKTGYTDLAGGNLVVAFNAGLDRPVIITVLNSSWSERFTDVLKLVSATQTALATE